MAEIKERYDLVVVGAGPGGYTAAFYAADQGLSVCLIDQRGLPGGVCLHEGCIPSKALLHAASMATLGAEAAPLGITYQKPELDFSQIKSWKDGVVRQLSQGLQALTRRRNVTFITARAAFQSADALQIEDQQGRRVLGFKHLLLASGSRAIWPSGWPHGARMMDASQALQLEEIPERLLVIGGGYIGLEMATVYAAFGSQIDIVEMADRLLPGMDQDLVQVLQQKIQNNVNNIYLSSKVLNIHEYPDQVQVEMSAADGSPQTQAYDRVLVAIGRHAGSDRLALQNTAIALDSHGCVKVDAQRRTTENKVFAIGDLVEGPMLAHKAAYEARLVVDVILGSKRVYDPRAIPAVVFTKPEIAVCGLQENEAQAARQAVQVHRFPFQASGRALALHQSSGFVKLLLNPQDGRVLGGGVVGAGAAELIGEIALAIEMGATAMDLALTIHAHPGLSESIMEAAEIFEHGQSTHHMPR
ncbi:MAG: dihydrolipoyl dehydrogenase [Leptospiraceae bacterium]|nr:dihydrolipoyl dehydrogenase [Leptospiraceae bacterium]